MSISMAALPTIAAATSSPSSSSYTSTFLHFSSPHLSTNLRISGIRKHCLKPEARPRTLTVVAAKKQTFSSFDDLLEKSEKPVLVDFYATWCGPCQFMVPILEEVSATIGDKIKVVKLDTEKYPAIANKYTIEALPTFILFKDGKPLDRFEGAMNADQLIQRIEASLQVQQ